MFSLFINISSKKNLKKNLEIFECLFEVHDINELFWESLAGGNYALFCP